MKEKIPMDIEWMKMKELKKINDRIKCWEKWAKTGFRTQGSGYTSENVKYLFFAQVEKQIWRWRIEKLKELVIDSVDICWEWGRWDIDKHFWETDEG